MDVASHLRTSKQEATTETLSSAMLFAALHAVIKEAIHRTDGIVWPIPMPVETC
jgi:hypothetical protein